MLFIAQGHVKANEAVDFISDEKIRSKEVIDSTSK